MPANLTPEPDSGKTGKSPAGKKRTRNATLTGKKRTGNVTLDRKKLTKTVTDRHNTLEGKFLGGF